MRICAKTRLGVPNQHFELLRQAIQHVFTIRNLLLHCKCLPSALLRHLSVGIHPWLGYHNVVMLICDCEALLALLYCEIKVWRKKTGRWMCPRAGWRTRWERAHRLPLPRCTTTILGSLHGVSISRDTRRWFGHLSAQIHDQTVLFCCGVLALLFTHSMSPLHVLTQGTVMRALVCAAHWTWLQEVGPCSRSTRMGSGFLEDAFWTSSSLSLRQEGAFWLRHTTLAHLLSRIHSAPAHRPITHLLEASLCPQHISKAASLCMDNAGHNHNNQPKSRGCAEKALEEGVLSMFPYLPIEPGRLRSDPSGGTAGQHRPHAAVRLVFMPPNISTVWITSSFLTETSPLLSQPTDHLSAHSELHNLLVAMAYRKSSERKYLLCSKCL